jgi:hypothetical protein
MIYTETTINLAAVSVLIASLTFVWALYKNYEEKKVKQIEKEREVSIHYFMSNKDGEISFDEIKNHYRNYCSNKRLNDDMTDENLRKIVIEMVKSKVLMHCGKDKYSLFPLADKDKSNNFLEGMLSLINNYEPVMRNLFKISEMKNQEFNIINDIMAYFDGSKAVSEDRLIAEFLQRKDYSGEEIKSTINVLVSRGLLNRRDGFLSLNDKER